MKVMVAWALSCVVFLGCASAPPDEVASATNLISVAALSRTELERENLALKKENQRLRRELVRQEKGEAKVDLSQAREKKGVAGEETNGKATDDGGFWLSTGSMKRHNSKCRYYKMGRGRPCQPNEGTPCKRCGG